MVNYKQFYTNNKPVAGKTKCCEEEVHNALDCSDIIPQKQGDYLKTKNYLSEYSHSDADKERVLKNLGIDKFLNDLTQGKIGAIYEDLDLGKFLAFSSEEDLERWKLTGDESLILFSWNNGLEKGLPIYTKSYADRLTNINPERYIVIPDETDITQAPEVEDKVYDTSINGPLANILFSAIRLLQAEITKIKNTFNYGIYSYSGTNTAISRIEGTYLEEDEEPLWAIDESELSLITEIPISSNTTLFPIDTSSLIVIGANSTLRVIGNAIWNDTSSIEQIKDSKLLIYITSSKNKIKVNLSSNFGTLKIDLSELTPLSFDNYNYLVIIGRKVENEGEYLGNNYIWISVTNPINNLVLVLGYYDNGILRKQISYVDNIYTIHSIEFEDLALSRCVIYSKYTDFSSEVISSIPDSEEYSYKAAHITIRSVRSYSVLESIKDLLPENELIFVEDTRRLFIKNNYKLIPISGNGLQIDDEGMTREETIELLEQYGIIKNDDGEISILDISDIIFIHLGSGLKYKIEIDSEGNFHSTLITDLEEDYTSKLELLNQENAIRGFVGRMHASSNPYTAEKDLILNSDRIKIGSFYAPDKNNSVFGCSHCFVELENTSDKDFLLDGCYLHFLRTTNGNYEVLHLPLKGIIPAGGTYLIRGAKKAEFNDPNTFIKVETFDLEWWIKDENNNNILLDFSHNGETIEDTSSGKTSILGNDPHGFALTFGNNFDGNELNYNTSLVIDNPDENHTSKNPKVYNKYFIDAVYYNSTFNKNSTAYWTSYSNPMFYIRNRKFLDCIYKNTFELDPAKLAYQALNTFDSSRIRNDKKSDFQYLYLNKEYIEFTKSDDKYPVSKFTPKASFEHKNVITDKTQLDINKPNAVTVSFGINPYTTRCFNWVSGGLFDEYVFIKDLSDNSVWHKFESYKEGDHTKTQELGALKRKEFNNAGVINYIYKRIVGRFPAANTLYTSHKCIINILEEAMTSGSPITYTYVVGRADKNGNPDLEHCSEELTFTLYPTSYIPRIYQITDQQGFHWVEYQAWAAAAKIVNELINNESLSENIIPILVNTGDMTQSGARINEWLDYYNAGKCLFNHLELMNIVGNNDLCDKNEKILGTGDDPGKSNPYYFHVFYCYEVEPIYKDEDTGRENPIYPIINGIYIPSIYKIEFDKILLLFINSELTETYCRYKLNLMFDSKVVNAYTGYTIDLDNPLYVANTMNFTPIYDILYKMTDQSQKELITFCHEMPFTVITHENVNKTYIDQYRSISDEGKLIGSHLNLISNSDIKGLHWFSRLLEYRNCKLCIGGHKHTYAITYPILENYKYTKEYNISTGLYDSVNKTSLNNGPMIMGPTLEHDEISWEELIDNTLVNTSKFPLIEDETLRGITWRTLTLFNPTYYVNSFNNNRKGVIYFMCQATGFKLMSNKELPTPYQTFSLFLPESTGNKDTNGYVTSISSASESQRSPMYSVFKFNNLLNKIDIFLIKLPYILKAASTLFTQLDYYIENKPNEKSYLIPTPNESLTDPDVWNYGIWNDGLEQKIIAVQL